jgi:hypothetical protein
MQNNGNAQALGFSDKEESMLSTLTMDVLKSSEIKGEKLNFEQVRSSIARKLGVEFTGMLHSDIIVAGVVEMMLDAKQKYYKYLDEERLFSWHAGLCFQGVEVACPILKSHVIDQAKCK